MPFTFNINFTSSGKAPSRISCIKSGTSVPDDTLKYFKLLKAASRFTPGKICNIKIKIG